MSLLRRACPLRPGERLQLDGRAFVFAGGFDAGGGAPGLRLEDAVTRAPASLTAEEYETAYAAGRVRISRAETSIAKPPAAVPAGGEGATARRRRLWSFSGAVLGAGRDPLRTMRRRLS